VILVIGAKS